MSNTLSAALLAEMFSQDSSDPFLMLVTLTHEDITPIYLVNNTVNITSRGTEFIAFPMKIRLPSDDGESQRSVSIDFDNVSLELIDEMRTITNPLDVKLEMILASNPDEVQLDLQELKLNNIAYDKQKITATLFMDSFLDIAMTSEKYTPTNYPGLF